jgi:hypothetical protein
MLMSSIFDPLVQNSWVRGRGVFSDGATPPCAVPVPDEENTTASGFISGGLQLAFVY